jgi:hypothetical protein
VLAYFPAKRRKHPSGHVMLSKAWWTGRRQRAFWLHDVVQQLVGALQNTLWHVLVSSSTLGKTCELIPAASCIGFIPKDTIGQPSATCGNLLQHARWGQCRQYGMHSSRCIHFPTMPHQSFLPLLCTGCCCHNPASPEHRNHPGAAIPGACNRGRTWSVLCSRQRDPPAQAVCRRYADSHSCPCMLLADGCIAWCEQ